MEESDIVTKMCPLSHWQINVEGERVGITDGRTIYQQQLGQCEDEETRHVLMSLQRDNNDHRQSVPVIQSQLTPTAFVHNTTEL